MLLRDDKSFPNILISAEHPYPQLKKHRGKKSEKGAYFGPFASAGAVNRTLNQLQKVFLLRNCSDSMFESRTRPCLQFQIKRCSAPCVGKISVEGYAELVADAERFLEGKTTSVQADLARDMAQASEAMEFERAAALRDRIKALTQIQQSQGINPQGVTEADVVALHLEHGQACVQVFFIRANQSWGNRDFYPRTGHEVIQDYLRTLDGSPGVYRMLNAASEVLYVGKARNLKARVTNYARPAGHSGRIARMIHETASMMFLSTRTELEALLLE